MEEVQEMRELGGHVNYIQSVEERPGRRPSNSALFSVRWVGKEREAKLDD